MEEHKETKNMTVDEAVSLGYAATGYGKDKKAKGEAPDAAAAGQAQEAAAEEKKAKEGADAPKEGEAAPKEGEAAPKEGGDKTEAKPEKKPVADFVQSSLARPQLRDHNGRLKDIPKEAQLSTGPAGNGDLWTTSIPEKYLGSSKDE